VLGDKYRLDGLLGAGGFGAVYQATQLDLGRQVAVKVLHGEGVSADTLSRFQREARATGSLGHPHIVQVTDFQRGPPAFLVMEYLRGLSLAQAMRGTPRFEPTRAIRIALQVLYALDATHRIGIVHRDIKPANLLLVETATDEDFVKVLDFGIAKDLSGSATLDTESGAVLGTLGYMAPEQALGLSVDERADIYALGGVLYRMLAGVTPTQAENVGELMRILAHGNIVPLEQRAPGLSPVLCAAVTRALAHDPEARFRNAGAFAHELAAAVGLRAPAWASLPDSSRGPNGIPTGGMPSSTVSPHADTRTAAPSRPSFGPPRHSYPPQGPTLASAPSPSSPNLSGYPPAFAPALPAPSGSAGKTVIIAMIAVVFAGLLVSVGALGALAIWNAKTAPAGGADAAPVTAQSVASATAAPSASAAPKVAIAAPPRVVVPPASARVTAPVAGVIDKKGKCHCIKRDGLGHGICETNMQGICLFTGAPGAPCQGFDRVNGEPANGTLTCTP